jgi:peroxiredoxin
MTSPSTIAERVAAMKAAMAASPSSEATGAFAREQAGLAVSGPAGIAPVGTVLPDAELLDGHGAGTTLYAAAGGGPSVLVFYRGAWCPYCNIALSVYQDQLLPQLTERGVRLVAISPQKPDGSLATQQKHSLAFTVVSDPGNAIAGRLGILTQPPGEARAAQLQLGLDTKTSSPPRPVRYVTRGGAQVPAFAGAPAGREGANGGQGQACR